MPVSEAFTPSNKVVLSGLVLGESPRWHNGRIWFADWGPGEIIAVDAAGGTEVVARAPAPPLSFDFLPDGRMLIPGAREPRLFRRELDGSLVPHADLSHLPDRSWNEIVVDGQGNTYINAVGFDMMAGEAFKPGIIAVVTPDGEARQVADDVAFPNGMAVTPDNRTLIVAESYGKRLTAFDILGDGDLANRRVWADLDDGVPDGITIDADGAVWYADVPNQRCVRVREGGDVLATVEIDRGCFACMLGGDDRRTLFITAAEWRGVAGMAAMKRTGVLLSVEAPAPGAGWP
jgi:sugar lactone lactonase YvrE